MVELVNLVRDSELLLGVETKLLLELLDVIGLECCIGQRLALCVYSIVVDLDVRAPWTLCPPACKEPKPMVVFKLIMVGLSVDFLASEMAASMAARSLRESVLQALVPEGVNSLVTLFDVKDLPSVGLVSGLDVLGERDGGVTIDGDLVVVVDGNEVTELQVTIAGQHRVGRYFCSIVTHPAREEASEETPS